MGRLTTALPEDDVPFPPDVVVWLGAVDGTGGGDGGGEGEVTAGGKTTLVFVVFELALLEDDCRKLTWRVPLSLNACCVGLSAVPGPDAKMMSIGPGEKL